MMGEDSGQHSVRGAIPIILVEARHCLMNQVWSWRRKGRSSHSGCLCWDHIAKHGDIGAA
jgi:hypothetical protein